MLRFISIEDKSSINFITEHNNVKIPAHLKYIDRWILYVKNILKYMYIQHVPEINPFSSFRNN